MNAMITVETKPVTPDGGGDSPLEIRLFGVCTLRVAGRPLSLPSRKEQWLLARLALRPDHDVSREGLAAALWPDAEESLARFYLRRALSHLRSALGDEGARLLSPSPRTVRLDVTGAFVDALAFDHALRSRDPARAAALYAGPLLPDCPDEWALAERESRAQAYLAALEALGESALTRGEPSAAVRWLRLAVAADPYRESAACALMRALAHGGDRAAISQVYRDLRARLHDDLNTAPTPETDACFRQWSAGDTAPPLLRPVALSETAARRNLPVPLTDLIGRRETLGEIDGALRRARLMTLLGAGGVGKTRLAIAAAEAALPRFAGGAWFVDLAPLSEAALVGGTVAGALGVGEPAAAGGTPEERLIAALASRGALLLVLDNCEHVLPACAALAHKLLSACPDLRILATSRAALGVTGEHVYAVPSLALPPETVAGHKADTALVEKDSGALMAYGAVRLFVERAIQANPAFRLGPRSIHAVAEICRRLDGIPLALEMAAARVRALSASEIEARLQDRFRLLTTGNRAAPPRQQTLRAAMDWSWDLLTDEEKTLLGRLSVFAGGGTVSAVEAMTPESAVPVFDVLAALVDKSLVICETQAAGADGDEGRYRLLETVRQYARERMAGRPDATDTRRRHRDFFLSMAETAETQAAGPEAPGWLARLDREQDNLRAALDFCLGSERHEDVEAGLRLAAALDTFWSSRGYLSEGRRRIAALLARPQSQTEALRKRRAAALVVAANFAACQGDYEAAEAGLEEVLALYRAVSSTSGIASALAGLAYLRGDPATRQQYSEQCLAIWREAGDQRGIAAMLNQLGGAASDQGDYPRCRRLLGESLALFRGLGSKADIARVLHSISYHAFLWGDFASARVQEEESLALHREIGNRLWELVNLQHLGWVCAALGDQEDAIEHLRASLRFQNELENEQELATAFECLGDIAVSARRWEQAAHFLGVSETLRQRNPRLKPAEGRVPTTDAQRIRLRAALGDETFNLAWERGIAMTVPQAIACALGPPP